MRVVLKIAFVVFICEVAIMLAFSEAQLLSLGLKHALMDGALLTLIGAPIIYYWVIQPYVKERDRAEEAHRAAQQAAEKANLAKTEFLATMSHELRTPLNAIIGFSEIIQTETLGPVGSLKYREYATDINTSGQHLLSLISDILDLSKIESGGEELREREVDVSEVVAASIKLLEQIAANGGVALQCDIADSLLRLRADERKLKQILVNLLSNAVKFTSRGGSVTLSVRCDPDGGYVFRVSDSGIGIASEDMPTALSQFGQVERAISREHEGAGLGLPLSKSLVEMHGGSLDVESEFGVGTTVTVRFPEERTVAPATKLIPCEAEQKQAG